MTGQPPISTAGPSPERSTLSRELGEFLIEFSIALHKHSMYPLGHPSLQPAAAGVLRRLVQLLRERATLSLGVARHQLIIEGVATDSKHPVLSELAGRLHRHHLGAVSFARGIEGGELEEALKLLSGEPGRGVEAIGLQPRDLIPHWDHVKLHAMTYDRLELLDEDGQPIASKAERAKSAQLWIGLARAALAGGLDDDAAAELKPGVLAEAINEHGRGEAYDQVIVGYLLQITEEVKNAGGREAMDLRKRTSRMLAELRPETLRRLVDMGGDLAQRHKFMLDVTHGMAVDAVVEIVRAAASSSGQTISHSLVRMLSKLAAHAEQGPVAARPLADAALREQVERLISGWQLDDPNPGAYGAALQQMSRTTPLLPTAPEAVFAPEDERLVEMAVEVDVAGPTVWAAVTRMVMGDRLSRLLELIEGAPPGSPTAAELRNRIFNAEAIARILAEVQPNFPLLDRLMTVVGGAAIGPLLDALAVADARAVRRALLDRLGKLGDAIVPEVLARLSDHRWYVVRNLLALLDDMAVLPAGFSPGQFRAHVDPRVRRQALKLELKHPAEREHALLAALSDQDPQTLHLALMAAQIECPPATVPLLLQHARDESLHSDYRVLAIKALGRSRAPEALLVLVDMTDGGRTLLGRAKLSPKSPELLAALQALAAGWGTDDRATSVLARAAQSADADVRAATDPGLGTA